MTLSTSCAAEIKAAIAKERFFKQRFAARNAGYTVHGPNDSSQGWSYCIEGDYSNEFPTETAAWEAAIAEMLTNTSTCTECEDKFAQVIGCPDGAEVCQACFDAALH